jgi:hypothetical protein
MTMDPAVAGLIGAFGGALLGAGGASAVSFYDRRSRQVEDRRTRVEEAAASVMGAALNLHALVPIAREVRDLPKISQALGGLSLTGNLLVAISGTMERAAVAHSVLRTSGPESVIVPADALIDTMEIASSAMAEGEAEGLDLAALTDRVAKLREAVRLHNGYQLARQDAHSDSELTS